jgi:NACHT domain
MQTLLIILFVGLLVFVCWQMFFSIKLKRQTLNFLSGGLGSGKTMLATKMALKLRNRSILLHWLFIWVPFKKFRERFRVRDIYSNYPIKINKKEWSKPICRDHLLALKELSQRCIVVLDEASDMFPNRAQKSDPAVTRCFRWFRHYTAGTLIMCDQSIGDIDIAVRRRINIVYNLSELTKPLFFFYRINVSRINYIEDVVTNVNDVNNFDQKYVFGLFGKKRYASRYMAKQYNPLKEQSPPEWKDFFITKENAGYTEIQSTMPDRTLK